MVHPMAECGSASAALRHVRELWGELCDPYVDPYSKLESVLAVETTELDLPDAFLSHIDTAADREVFDVFHAGTLDFEAGEAVPLSESYCRQTIASPDGTLAISDALAEGWGGDPAYERLGTSTYLGATVEVANDLYGTLCFVSQEPRADPITEAEVDIVDMLAEWAGYELTMWAEQVPAEPAIEDREMPVSLWPAEMDTLMQALSSKPRRIVLESLEEGSIETLEDLLDAEGVDSRDVVSLEHNHLPQLADAGYIEWDREAGTIEKGPEFEAVERVLACLTDTIDEIT